MARERRKDFDRTLSIRMNDKDSVDKLIKDLRDARKICLHRGGNAHVTIRDTKEPGVRVVICMDLTTDALRRHGG